MKPTLRKALNITSKHSKLVIYCAPHTCSWSATPCTQAGCFREQLLGLRLFAQLLFLQFPDVAEELRIDTIEMRRRPPDMRDPIHVERRATTLEHTRRQQAYPPTSLSTLARSAWCDCMRSSASRPTRFTNSNSRCKAARNVRKHPTQSDDTGGTYVHSQPM